MTEGIPGNFPERYKGAERIRISVINLVHTVKVNETGEMFQIAHLNKKHFAKTGERKFQALGGAVKMTPEGQKELEHVYGAMFGVTGRSEEESNDARFFVSKDTVENGGLSKILERFASQNKDFFEDDVLRETREELVDELRVLSKEEAAQLSAQYQGAVSPIQWEKKTSVRETGEPSERIFHLFELDVPQVIFEKLQQSPELRLVSESDARAMRDAVPTGNASAMTEDGAIFVENIFPESIPTDEELESRTPPETKQE